jgi:hypothetical protein
MLEMYIQNHTKMLWKEYREILVPNIFCSNAKLCGVPMQRTSQLPASPVVQPYFEL